MNTQLTTPNEDYLERIWELLDEKGYARVTDIAERLKVTPASVTVMLQKLEVSGHILRERYRGFTLTPKGKAVGVKIRKRHTILSEFLRRLGLPDKTIEHDIEGLEHYLSGQTLQKLESLVKHLDRHPMK